MTVSRCHFQERRRRERASLLLRCAAHRTTRRARVELTCECWCGTEDVAGSEQRPAHALLAAGPVDRRRDRRGRGALLSGGDRDRARALLLLCPHTGPQAAQAERGRGSRGRRRDGGGPFPGRRAAPLGARGGRGERVDGRDAQRGRGHAAAARWPQHECAEQ